MLLKATVAIIIAFANGLMVGSGLVAFLAIIGLIPRLAEVTRTERSLRLYELAMVCGATLAALEPVFPVTLSLPAYCSIIPGLFIGLFVGCLAAALAEVLNVLPVMASRLGLSGDIRLLVLAMVVGKVIGSLIYWIVPGF
jgi:stage V sporulation protein AB